MKARAVVFTGQNTVEFKEVACPEPGPRDAVIRVTHSWVSNGTEGSYLRGERISGDTARRPGDPVPFPLVPGYQKVGVVEWVGEEINDLSPGETVFCSVGKVEGMFFPVGGHLSPSVSSRDEIWKIPDSPEPLAFSGLVLTQVGYNCGTRAPIRPGQYAVVIGDGPVGQWASQTLAYQGAVVFMVGVDDYRLSLAEKTGNCQGINLKKKDWVSEVRSRTKEGVAVVVDAVGSIEAVEKSVSVMVRGGHIVSAGFYGTDDRISLQPLRDWELSINAVSASTPERMDKTRELIAGGNLKTLPLITHRFPASKASEAWDTINSRRQPVLGVILDW